MPNLKMGQIILEAQRMASRLRDLENASNIIIEEAENNSHLIDNLRQYRDDIEFLNGISNKRTNVDMISRIQHHNANSTEIIKENRELKAIIEDYECAMEMVMQKYREQTMDKILKNNINFKDLHNESLWDVIRNQREKINEMAAVMQKAASVDDDIISKELQTISRLQLENKTLRELLQISEEFSTSPKSFVESECLKKDKEVQTECEDEDISLSYPSQCNMSSDSVIHISDIVNSNNVVTGNNGKPTSTADDSKTGNEITQVSSPLNAVSNASAVIVEEKNLPQPKTSSVIVT